MPLPTRRQAGFSLIELVVALLVAMVLMAISMPIFMRAYRSYQLTTAARQMADILRLSRYEAIRLNKPVKCFIHPDSTDPTLTRASMTDLAGNPLAGIGAAAVVLTPAGNLVDAGSVPATGALPGLAHLSGIAPTNFPPGGGTVQFDPRGAVTLPANVNVFYLANFQAPEAGYRAVLLMPAGSIQIWSADSSGNWQEQR